MLYIFSSIALINLECIFVLLSVGFALVPGAMLFMLSMREPGIKRHEKVKIGCSLLVSAVLLVVGCISPVTILVSECPNLAPEGMASLATASKTGPQRAHSIGETITTYYNNSLDVLVRYDEWDSVTGQRHEHALMLKYNMTTSRIEKRIWKPETKSWHQLLLQQHQATQDAVCTSQKHSRFYFLEDEIREALADRRAATEATKSVLFKTAHDSTRAQSLDDEDAFDHHRRIRKICRHEHTELILFLVFLVVLFVLSIVTFLFYVLSVETLPDEPLESETTTT
jgi:hypothetical protein